MTTELSQAATLKAILSAREAIGKHGLQVPQEIAIIQKSTLDNLTQAGASVAKIGLGLWHVEEIGKDSWLAKVVSSDE